MTNCRSVRILRGLSSLGALAAMLAVSASPAQAQLGRLKKAAEEAARKKAGLDKPEEAAKKVDEARAATEDATISVERIDAIVAVLQPMVAAAERKAAAAAAEADYEREKKQASSCLETFGKAGVMVPTGATGEKYAKIATDVSATNDRAQQAMQAGDYRRAITTSDSAMVLQMQSMAVLMNAKCKPYPYKPAAMVNLEAQNLSDASNGKVSDSESGSGSLEVPSKSRGGMSTRMFGLTRERIALYGLLAARAITNNQAGKEGVFSDAERAALDSRKDVIAKLTPAFKGDGLQWKGWADLKSW